MKKNHMKKMYTQFRMSSQEEVEKVTEKIDKEDLDTSDFDTDFASKDTDDLSEGTTNLYYTNTRVNSFLTGGTVSEIRTSDLDIKNTAGTEQIASFAQNGSVTLYYDNSAKFSTITSGARLTGDLVMSSNVFRIWSMFQS